MREARLGSHQPLREKVYWNSLLARKLQIVHRLSIYDSILKIIHVDEFTEMDLERFKDLEYLRGFRRTLEQDLNVSPPSLISL